MYEEPMITDITRWGIKPGDRLIARVNRTIITREEAERAGALIRERLELPDDVRVVIATREWTFEVAGDE